MLSRRAVSRRGRAEPSSVGGVTLVQIDSRDLGWGVQRWVRHSLRPPGDKMCRGEGTVPGGWRRGVQAEGQQGQRPWFGISAGVSKSKGS